MCWDVADPNDKAALNLFSCHGYGGNQLWRYRPVSFNYIPVVFLLYFI